MIFELLLCKMFFETSNSQIVLTIQSEQLFFLAAN